MHLDILDLIKKYNKYMKVGKLMIYKNNFLGKDQVLMMDLSFYINGYKIEMDKYRKLTQKDQLFLQK